MTKMFEILNFVFPILNFEKIKWFRLQVLSPNPLVKKKKMFLMMHVYAYVNKIL